MSRYLAAVVIWLALASGVAGQSPTSLTLEEAVALALTGNRDLRSSLLELDQAEGQVREAWGDVFPTLDLSASYTRNLSVPGTFLPRIFVDPSASPDELIAVKFGADNAWNLQLQAEQTLFHASVFLGVGAASRYEALQRELVRGSAMQLVTRVRRAYYDVLLAQEGERLSENTVRRVQQTLEETRKMFAAGVVSQYDVLRLEVELANIEPSLRRARNAAAAARRHLAVEVGLSPDDSIHAADSLTPEVAAHGAADGARGPLLAAPPDAVQLAWQNRSELRQLELTEQLRRTEYRAEQADYLPRVSLFGTYSINAQQSGAPAFFGESEAQRAYGRQVGVRVTMPLFAGMKRPARLAQRRAALTLVQTQRDLARDQVEQQVLTVLEDLTEARARLLAQQVAVERAQRAFAIVTVQYREGISSALEVTDAEVALRQSEFNRAEAAYDVLIARALTEEAMGIVDIASISDGRIRSAGGNEQ